MKMHGRVETAVYMYDITCAQNVCRDLEKKTDRLTPPLKKAQINPFSD